MQPTLVLFSLFSLCFLAPVAALSDLLIQLAHRETVKDFFLSHSHLAPLVTHNYSFTGFEGFSGRFSKLQTLQLRQSFRIAAVTEDVAVRTTNVQYNAPRHLARLSQRSQLPLVTEQWAPNGAVNFASQDLNYHYTTRGQEDMDIYVIDSGIATDHPQFNGRAQFGTDLTGEGPDDKNGHGTHVAGIIGSKSFGTAKNVQLIAVKVLGMDGVGNLSSVVAGINYAVNEYSRKKGSRRAVANLSFGAGYNTVLNAAINAAVDAGLPIVVAAGNANSAACITSPASATKAVTVGAIDDQADTIASFSNWGACVDLFASGVYVMSTSNVGNGTAAMSGTSMAAPAVAGLLAMFMGLGDTPDEAIQRLMRSATENAIPHFSVTTRPRSPNLIAFGGQDLRHGNDDHAIHGQGQRLVGRIRHLLQPIRDRIEHRR